VGSSEIAATTTSGKAMPSTARALVLGAGLLLVVPAAAADDFARGLSAYNAAEYETAFDAWYPLAEENDPKAQAAVAFLYLKGLGVRQDDARAAEWYRRAAQLGRPEAQFFLGTLYYLGRGVPQSDKLAHVWCEIALAGGIPAGLDCRDAASARMTQGEVRAAYRMAAEWLERGQSR
jgi:TPR repeat protein